MTSSETDTGSRPFAGELDDLARSHRATWLAEVLPPGPCLLWGGGVMLATVLAADRSRTVMLLERSDADVEHAMRRLGPGVRARRVPAAAGDDSADGRGGSIADTGPLPDGFTAAVVVLSRGDQPLAMLGSLVDHLADDAAVVVIAPAGEGAAIADWLRALGRSAEVCQQVVRAASCIAVGDPAGVSPALGELQPAAPEADLVLVGVSARQAVLLGGGAGPATWWRDPDQLAVELRRLDQEIGTEDVLRIEALEAGLAAEQARRVVTEHQLAERDAQVARHEARIAELLASTSWRISAPVRWLSEAVRRR